MMGDERPTSRRFVDEIVEPSSTVGLAGLEFTVRGLGPGESHEDSLSTVGEHAVVVADDAIREAQAALRHELRLIAEPGGATALAAIRSGAYRPERGERVAAAVCGSNRDPVAVAPGS